MKGDKRVSAADVGFVSVKIRTSTFLKLKAHKARTRVPMAATIDEAVEEKLGRRNK